ncbi:malic enzyme-like NAD(P)-binding protein, partial [Vibrio sp. 1637]|uniref:malic enzyme-like NAD(P)-binding protein n=1 Tax=Vibrio sp. 1637 TaxID=3074569 RepID=UPI0029645A81
MNSQNEKFYRQMLDEQMASELSAIGFMGLEDMIVALLTAGQGNDKSETAMRDAANSAVEYRRVDPKKAREIEKRLIERCDVPVFHDDQHGTAIVTAAGMLNAIELQGKKLEDSTIVCLGAGAAAVACMELLIKCGAMREKIYMLDRKGVIHTRRDDLNEYKQLFANNTDKRTL